jgi:hypothetical protein
MKLMVEPQKDDQQTVIPTPSAAAVQVHVGAAVNAVPPAPANVPASPAAPPQAPPTVAAESETSLPEPEPESSPVDEAAQSVTWKASEFHVHQKSSRWYMTLAFGTVVLAVVLYFLTKSVVTPVVVIICGLILGIYAKRQPGQLEYTMNRHGIRIGPKQYLYNEFRLFVVTPASALSEVTLIPTKRFMPSLSIPYSPDIEDKVLNILAAHLPYEERRLDLIDSLMQRMHF